MGFRFVGGMQPAQDRMRVLEVRTNILAWVLVVPKFCELVWDAAVRTRGYREARKQAVAAQVALYRYRAAVEAGRTGITILKEGEFDS